MHTIYVHTNKHNGKQYVGQTKKSLSGRWYKHVYDATSDNRTQAFHHAIRKHGADSFYHDVLQVVPTQEAANDAEIFWISYLKSNQKSHGYNLTSGGCVGAKVSDETRAKQSVAARARCARWTDEYRSKVSTSIKKTWSDPARVEAQRSKALRRCLDPEYRAKQSAGWANIVDSETRTKAAVAMGTDEVRAKLSASATRRSSTDEWRAQFAEEAKTRWQDPAYREKMQAASSKSSRERWADPVWKANELAKRAAARAKKAAA